MVELKKLSLHLLVFFMTCLQSATGQKNEDYFFQKVTGLPGVSSQLIQSIFEDSKGFIWIGTSNGLFRYDGRNLNAFHHNSEDPNSLPRESTRPVAEDQDGNIWITADYGVIRLNPVTEKFHLYKHDDDNPGSLPDDHVPNILIDGKNNLWVATVKGLHLSDPQKRTFQTFTPVRAGETRINPALASIGKIIEGKNNCIWAGGLNVIHRFDPLKRSWQSFPFKLAGPDYLSDMMIDHEGNFWSLWTKTGLVLFYPDSGSYDTKTGIIGDRESLFWDLSEWRDPSGTWWIVFLSGRGMVFYDPKKRCTRLISAETNQTNASIRQNQTCIYTDRENRLWIGSTNGIRILDNADQLFHAFKPVQSNFPEDHGITGDMLTLYEDDSMKMISFFKDRGLGIYTPDWKPVRFFGHIPPGDTSRESRNIVGIWKDPRGIFWFTTDNGLVKFNLQKNIFKYFKPPGENKGAPVNMRDIVPFGASEFYIRTRNNGIYKFDFKTELFTGHLINNTSDPNSLPVNDLRKIIRYNDNSLIIITTAAGILIYHPRSNSFEKINHHPDASVDDALHNLYYGCTLSGDILWLNSAHGLLKFDINRRTFELFNQRNNLANDFVISNVLDKNGLLWVSHNAGISVFDTIKHTFTNFGEANGLVLGDFNPNMQEMSDGNIYLSSGDNLIWFNPNQFRPNQNIPQVHITSVKVLSNPYPFDIDPVTLQKSLVLNYDQNLVTVDFSVLNLSHPLENSFYYRMDNEAAWQKLGDGQVNLVKLSPGSYELHVTGSNDNGLMNPTGDTLYIRIIPPFYLTWWFLAIVTGGIILAIFLIQRMRINNIRRDEEIKTEFNRQLAKAETKALRSQMNPHFIFNSLNSINSFVLDKQHELASGYLIKFSKLIRLILDNSRSETITLEKELETLNLYVLLEAARYDNKFRCIYKISGDVDPRLITIPPMLIQPFVENAIWHGLMQKEGEGTIVIEVGRENTEFLRISIEDDGIGREKAAQLKSKSSTHKSHGLKVTSLRIEMMNKLHATGARVEIADLKDGEGHAVGTRVVLFIPLD